VICVTSAAGDGGGDERGVVTNAECSVSHALAGITGASQIGPMEGGYQQQRHRVERRVRPDRRTGMDRRVTERRLRSTAVLVERRGLMDRRKPVERRDPEPRRFLRDRRGSGLSFNPS
jgi:hypothetical protein